MANEIQAIRLLINAISLFQCSSQCLSQFCYLNSFSIIPSYHSQTASLFNPTNNVIPKVSLDHVCSSSRHISQFNKIKEVLKKGPKCDMIMYSKVNYWNRKKTCRELEYPGESTFIFLQVCHTSTILWLLLLLNNIA